MVAAAVAAQITLAVELDALFWDKCDLNLRH